MRKEPNQTDSFDFGDGGGGGSKAALRRRQQKQSQIRYEPVAPRKGPRAVESSASARPLDDDGVGREGAKTRQGKSVIPAPTGDPDDQQAA